MNNKHKEYTAWRRFLAWVGLISLTLLAIGIVAFLIWGNAYITAAGY